MRTATAPAQQISRLLSAQGRDMEWLASATAIPVADLDSILLSGDKSLSLLNAAVIADALGCELPFLIHGNAETAVGIPQIAVMLGVSTDTVYRMVRSGDLPGFKLKGVWRFFPSEVKEHVKAGKSDPWQQSTRSRSRKRAA